MKGKQLNIRQHQQIDRIINKNISLETHQIQQTKMSKPQPIQSDPQLNVDQTFQRILISTPLQQKYYDNISFKTAQQTLMNQMNKLIGSSFYTNFIVYLGSQNLSKRSYIQDKYKREEEILKLKIQETKKNIYQLSKASDQLQFDHAMKNYINNLKIINQRSQDVDHVDFVPCIYVEAKKKKPFYGQLIQEFNRKGAGMINAKLGLRSPFSKLDALEFKLQTPITNIRRKYFNFDIEWHNSYQKYGDVFTKLSHNNQSLFKDIDEKSHSFNIGIEKKNLNLRVQWENKLRNPIIHQKFDQYCLKNYHLPSFKSSFKLSKVWKDSIQFNDVSMGQYIQTKGQFTVPFLSRSQMTKFQLNYRRFFDTYALKKYFDSQLIKKILYGSSIETNVSWNVTKTFLNKYISDVGQNMEIRGFDQPRVPIPTFSNCKISAKFNIHNYPWIGQAKITPFLYLQTGFSYLDLTQQKMQQNTGNIYGMGSLGMGVAYYLNKFMQIQLIYSLGSYQNLKRRQPTGFQVRIGIFD